MGSESSEIQRKSVRWCRNGLWDEMLDFLASGDTTHRVDSSVTLHINIFERPATSFFNRVRERSSEDLVSNFPG